MATQPDTRADRASEEQQVRRRRADGAGDGMSDLKLSVPFGLEQKHPDRVFFWANDEGAKIHDLTVLDDWNVVEGIDPRPVGEGKNGEPVVARLLWKLKAHYEEDELKAERKRRDVELGIVRDQLRGPGDDTPDEFRSQAATKGNRIGGVHSR